MDNGELLVPSRLASLVSIYRAFRQSLLVCRYRSLLQQSTALRTPSIFTMPKELSIEFEINNHLRSEMGSKSIGITKAVANSEFPPVLN